MNYLEEENGFDFATEPEVVMQINRELELARRVIEETGANLFLTGKAGTGKTTFLKRLVETTGKRMVVLAPTGVAAINAGGMTLHSFFQLPFSVFIPGKGFIGEEKKYYRFGRDKRRLIASLDLIVIDEISMVRPDTLDGIDTLLRRLRGIDRPFGGVQLLLIGDLRQLAPVVRPDEWDMLRGFYNSPYFFESHALREVGFLTIELKAIYRQQDPEFIGLLNAVRDGKADAGVLSTLNRLCRPAYGVEELDRTIRLTTHNRIADYTNARNLALLDAEPCVFEADIKGKFPESSFPADRFLTLKTGARVMFIKNDTGADRQYYNGLIGTVIGMTEDTVCVLPDDDAMNEIEVGRVIWENISYSIDEESKEVVQRVDGTYSQIPLRLAWAITIHKSQGLTFDRAVIDASQSFAPGQLYVALSRCRSMQGMRLETRITPSAVIIDNNVNTFINNSRQNSPDENKLAELRNEYFRTLLAELFNFRTMAVAFDEFSRYVLEYVAPIETELFDKYRNASRYFKDNIENVGNRFISLYASGRIDSEVAVKNESFRQKIKAGCQYFLEKFIPLCELLNNTPVELENAGYEKRLRNAADILWFEMHLKKTVFKGLLTEDFTPAIYMRLKAEAVLTSGDDTVSNVNIKDKEERKDKFRPVKAKREKLPKKGKKPKGYSQRITLRMFLDGNSMDEIATTRQLAKTTIAHHIADMILAGELQLDDVIPAGILQTLNKVECKLQGKGEVLTFQVLNDALETKDESEVGDKDRLYVNVFYHVKKTSV